MLVQLAGWKLIWDISQGQSKSNPMSSDEHM